MTLLRPFGRFAQRRGTARPRRTHRLVLVSIGMLLASASSGEPPILRQPIAEIAAQVEQTREGAVHHLIRVIRHAEGAEPMRYLGTGVSLGEGRYLTLASVVGPASSVRIATASGDTATARVVGVDRRTNVALIECRDIVLPAIQAARTSLSFPGDFVVAVGLGRPGLPQATFGTVMLAEGLHLGLTEVEMIQVSAPFFPGFSGGALLDRQGRLLGLIFGRMTPPAVGAILPPASDLVSGYVSDGRLATTALAITVALPASHALGIARSLEEHGYVQRGYIGLEVELSTAPPRPGVDRRGVLVHQVVPDGPAALGGLLPGDVILNYAGLRVTAPENLSFLVTATLPGSEVEIEYLRRGRRRLTRLLILQSPDLPWSPGMDQALSASTESDAPAPIR